MQFSHLSALLFAATVCAQSGSFFIKINGRFRHLRRVMYDDTDLIAIADPRFPEVPFLQMENGEVSYTDYDNNNEVQVFGKIGDEFSFGSKDKITPFKVEMGEGWKVKNLEVQVCQSTWQPLRVAGFSSSEGEQGCIPKEVYFISAMN